MRGGEDRLVARLFSDRHVREIGVVDVVKGYDPVKSTLEFPGGEYAGLDDGSIAFLTGVVDFFFDGFAKRMRRRVRRRVEGSAPLVLGRMDVQAVVKGYFRDSTTSSTSLWDLREIEKKNILNVLHDHYLYGFEIEENLGYV